MEQEEDNYIAGSADPITFGSLISLSLDTDNKVFLSSEGFVNSKLHVERYDNETTTSNFTNCVFRILPFSSFTNFKNQNELYQLLQDFDKEARNLSEKSEYFSIHTKHLRT